MREICKSVDLLAVQDVCSQLKAQQIPAQIIIILIISINIIIVII